MVNDPDYYIPSAGRGPRPSLSGGGLLMQDYTQNGAGFKAETEGFFENHLTLFVINATIFL